MSRESLSRVVALAIVASAFATDRAYGVDPNPLQSAYWRFEEGVADGYVTTNPPANPQTTIHDTVIDSLGANHMEAYNTDTAPKYVNYSLPPTNLKSGFSNSLAWEVAPHAGGGGRDAYSTDRDWQIDTTDGKLKNGIIGGMYDPDGGGASGPIPSTTTGFTLEAAFSVFDYASFHSIVAKEGRPGLEQATHGGQVGDANFQALPTIALKVRGASSPGDPDQGKLQIELFDGAGNLKSVMTDQAMVLGDWYYAAVVNDGQTMSLYLDHEGTGYELVGSASVNGALFQGMNHDNANWAYNWTIGRGAYGGPNPWGDPADFFNGLIDEVRITSDALDPSEFLFAQEASNGDFNGDHKVDGADFLEWQRGNSTTSPLSTVDLQAWKDHFGSSVAAAVPEPATLCLAGLAIAGLLARRMRS